MAENKTQDPAPKPKALFGFGKRRIRGAFAFLVAFLLIYLLLFESDPPPTFDEVEIKFEDIPKTDFSERKIAIPADNEWADLDGQPLASGEGGDDASAFAPDGNEHSVRSEAAIVRERPELQAAVVPSGEGAPTGDAEFGSPEDAGSQQDATLAGSADLALVAEEATANASPPSAPDIQQEQDGGEERSANVSGIFVIQAASMSSEDNARKLASMLTRKLSQSTSVKRVELGGRTMYRVWIGPYDDLAEVKDVMDRLKSIEEGEFSNAFVRAIL